MSAVKKYSGLFALLGFLVLLFVLMRRPAIERGTELSYRLPADAPAGVEDVVRARVSAFGGQVERKGDVLLVRVAPEEVADVQRLLRRRGTLEFRPAAEREAQRAFKAGGAAPEGFEALEVARPEAGYEDWAPRMLVEKACALGGGRVLRAAPVEAAVDVELDERGAKAFDAAAARLAKRTPPGLMAVVVDGRLLTAPAMKEAGFEGRLRVAGLADARAAKELAIALLSGPLPVPLDAPESERPYERTK